MPKWSLNMLIKIRAGKQDVELTLDEAKKLADELRELLGDGRVNPPMVVFPACPSPSLHQWPDPFFPFRVTCNAEKATSC